MLIPEKYGVIQNGVEVEVTTSNFSGVGLVEERSVNSIRVMPWGYPDVYSMLNSFPFFAAHRGGSGEWPEMTLRAYTQAVAEGYGCLEISLGRTSDGVIFGLHDGNISRTSHGDFPAVSTMTWAEVQAEVVYPPDDHPDRAPEPYMLLTELVEAYGPTHILLVDPKFLPVEVYPELLDYMDANGGPMRWIGKHVGDNSTWAGALRDRGYERWGAYFQNDWVAGGPTPPGWDDWTFLGLEFGASQAHYDDMLATGKKILTHVCYTQENVDMAFSKGASGVQVGGTEAISPYQKFTGISNFSGSWAVNGSAIGGTLERAGMAEHNIFGSVAPPDLPLPFDDGDPSIVTGAAFYSVSSTYWVLGGRVWVPAEYVPGGVDANPTTATIELRTAPISTNPDFSTAPLATAEVDLIPGRWCEARWNTPIEVASGGAGVSSWITLSNIEDWYFFSDGLTLDPIQAHDDTDIYLAETEHRRGAYRIGVDTTNGTTAWYGIDIIVSSSPPSIAEWSFNEGVGAVAVDSISGRVLNVVEGNWTTGKNVGGLASAGGPVVLSDLTGLETTSRTIMFWGYRGNVSGSYRTVSFLDSLGNSVWGVSLDNGSNQYNFRINLNGTLTNLAGAVRPAEEWHHYALTWDGAALKGYIDGVLVNSATLAGGVADAVNVSLMPDGGNQKIDDLRLFDEALTLAQITEYMNLAVDPTYEGQAIGTFQISGAAIGDAKPGGSGTGPFDYEGAAAGELVAGGTAVQNFDFVGTAEGERVQKGTASSTITSVGSATGKRVATATATGTNTYTGTAVGRQPKKGSVTGSFDYASSAFGIQDRYGYSMGSWGFSGSASGVIPKRGSVSGTNEFKGTASGKRFVSGSSSRGFSFTASAFGKFTPIGETSIALSVSGEASGSDVALPRDGAALGLFGWTGFAISDPPHEGQTSGPWPVTGTATGKKPAQGTATSDVTVAGTASGGRPGAGTGLGAFQVAGGAHGELARDGVTSSIIRWKGKAYGKEAPKGSCTGGYLFAGAVLQYAEVPPFECVSVDDELIMIAVEDS